MTLVHVATAASTLAFFSGILAVGRGSHWQFSRKDILRGKRNAILYIWVTFSSIFSLAHLASLFDYGLTYHWLYRTYDTGRWMAIHTGIACLLVTAHIYILQSLRENGTGDEYLWGKRLVR